MDLNKAIAIVQKEVRETEWRVLGRELGLQDPKVDHINHDYRYDGLEEIIHQMLKHWKDRNGEDATVEKLASALVLSGNWTLATTIYPGVTNSLKNHDHCKTLKASLSNEETMALQDMTAMLRQRYSSTQLPNFAWEEDTHLPLEEMYVELSLCQIDKWEEEGTPIKMEQVFEVNQMSPSTKESIKKRYLIEGGPGYGKTTMLTKIGYDWATDKNYVNDQFHVVIILSLRELHGSLNELLNTEVGVEGHSDEAMGTLMKKLQSRVLLLLDGYDELPPGKHEDLDKLLKGEQYPRMTIFLTSRLRYTDIVRKLGSFWNQRIEIKGISEEQRKEFLRKYLKVSPEVVEEKMSLVFKKPIDGLFECPLFLILIATVTQQELLDSISTKTQLYKTVFTFMVRRSLIRERLLVETTSFDIFSYLNDETRAKKFLHLIRNSKSHRYYRLLVLFGQFAVSMIKQSKLHFHRDEVLKICGNSRDIFCLGFLMPTVKNNGTRYRETNYYEPVHKSFLEFLAALYLADLAQRNSRRRFTCEAHSLLKSGLQPESTVFLFSFLGGLLGNKANWLLEDVIYVSVSKFSNTERQMIFQVISDMNASEELMKCVNQILPNCINLDEYNKNQEARASVQCGLVITLECNLNTTSMLSAVNVENIVFTKGLFDISFSESITSLEKTCKRLICNLYGNIFSDLDFFQSELSLISAEKISYYMWSMEHSGTSIPHKFSADEFLKLGNRIDSITVVYARAIDLRYIIDFLPSCNDIRHLAIYFKTLYEISDELVLQFFSTVLAQKHLGNCVICVPSGKQLLSWRELFNSSINRYEIDKENIHLENRRNTSLKVTLCCSQLEVADCKLICEEEIMDGLYFTGHLAKLSQKQCYLIKEIIFCNTFYDIIDLRNFPNVETVIITDVQFISSILELHHPVLKLILVYNNFINPSKFYYSYNLSMLKQIEDTISKNGRYIKSDEFDNFHHSFMLKTTMNYEVPCDEEPKDILKCEHVTLKLFTNLLNRDLLKINLKLIKDLMLKNYIARCIVVCQHIYYVHSINWTSTQFKSYLHVIFPPSLFSITEQLNEPLCMLETFPNTLTNNYEFYREYVITCNQIN